MDISRQALVGILLLGLAVGAVPAITGSQTDSPAAGDSAGPASSDAAPPEVTILPDTLTVARMVDGRAEIPIVITNNGSDARIWFDALLFNSRGNRVAVTVAGLWRQDTKDKIKSGESVPVTLIVRPSKELFHEWRDARLPLRGHLDVLTTTDLIGEVEAKSSAPRELVVPQVQPAAAEVFMLFGTFILAAVIVWIAARFQRGKLPAGPAALSADSLASTVGVGVGLLDALLALNALPELTRYANRETYALLVAVFAAVIALSPAVANLLEKVTAPRWPFHAAAFLALWGALGQFAIAMLVVVELHEAGALASSSHWLLLSLAFTTAVAVAAFVVHAVARPEGREEPVQEAVTEPAGAAQRATRRWSVP